VFLKRSLIGKLSLNEAPSEKADADDMTRAKALVMYGTSAPGFLEAVIHRG